MLLHRGTKPGPRGLNPKPLQTALHVVISALALSWELLAVKKSLRPPWRETEVFLLISVPTLPERSFIDPTWKGCCSGTGLHVCTNCSREVGSRAPKNLLGWQIESSFSYQHSLPCLGPTALFNPNLREIEGCLEGRCQLQERGVGGT